MSENICNIISVSASSTGPPVASSPTSATLASSSIPVTSAVQASATSYWAAHSPPVPIVDSTFQPTAGLATSYNVASLRRSRFHPGSFTHPARFSGREPHRRMTSSAQMTSSTQTSPAAMTASIAPAAESTNLLSATDTSQLQSTYPQQSMSA